jgi:peptidoglycan/xylan/chitin deacetylase (PgdA/CDA1 family)
VNAPEIEPYHQLHPADSRRAELNRLSLAHFKSKHPDVFSSLNLGEDILIPGVDVLRQRTVHRNKPASLEQLDKNSGFLALTFDDGPHPVGTPHLLRLLGTFQAKATFFVLGSNAVRYPEILRSIAAAGCEIGVHGWEHTPSREQTSREARHDLERTVAAIANITGIRPRFCRPPYGKTSLGYVQAAAQVSLIPIGWDVSALDWRSLGQTDLMIELATKQVLGKIVLLHDGAGDPNSMLEVLEWLLGCARKNGVEVVSLSEAQRRTRLPILERSAEKRRSARALSR